METPTAPVASHDPATCPHPACCNGTGTPHPSGLYAGSYGFRDCDPIATVWGFDPATVDEMISEQMAEEIERVRDNCDNHGSDATPDETCERCECDDLVSYGVSVFTHADFAESIRALHGIPTDLPLQAAYADMRENGTYTA